MTSGDGTAPAHGAEGATAGTLDAAIVTECVARALDEDRAAFDVTTVATVPPWQQGRGLFLFREPGILCGLALVCEAFEQTSPELSFEAKASDGAEVAPAEVVATVRGPLAAILSAERVALNFLQRLSGIATVSRRYVREAAAGGPARVVDTRKTTPGLRALERYAVRTGGAHNHRNTLEDGVLIKDNHLAAAAARGLGIRALVANVRGRVPHTLRIEVEADTPEQAFEAARAGADIVLLDNMDPEAMSGIVSRAGPAVLFEASGGVRLETIRAIAASGVQLVSVGALTHSAPALDISLDLEPAAAPGAAS